MRVIMGKNRCNTYNVRVTTGAEYHVVRNHEEKVWDIFPLDYLYIPHSTLCRLEKVASVTSVAKAKQFILEEQIARYETA
jgi:hypothetical protein